MSKVWKEVGVCLAFIAVAALVYRDSLKLPPGGYDPLGSGTMPRIVCGTIIVLTLAALAQSLVPALLRANAPAAPEPAAEYQQRPRLAAMIFGVLVLYTISMQARVPFAISTSVFLFVSTMLLVNLRVRMIPAALIMSIGSGLALNYLFSGIFKVDLP